MIGLLLLVTLLTAPGRTLAQSPRDTAGIGAALQRYTNLVRRMDADSIGALYLPDGVLGNTDRPPVVGPRAVTAFLHAFDNYHVVDYATRSDSIRVTGDTVRQAGRWWQRVVVPSGDTVSVSGGLLVEWVRSAQGAWRVKRMSTFPRNAGPWPSPSTPRGRIG